MELSELLGSVQFILAMATMLLSGVWFWRMSLAGLGATKMLRDFNLVRVLKRSDTELALLGNFKSDNHKKTAVLIIQTAAMDTGALDQLLKGMSLHKTLVNDIYSSFQGDVSRAIKPYKVNLIYPATERHVQKHTDQNFHMVVETKETYQTITKPFIDSIPAENIEWVHNILDHKSETERVIYEDTNPRDGFILLPDFKWSDPSNLESLYCLAIVHDRSLRSLRDLTGSHLKLLQSIRKTSLQVLNAKFGVEPSSMRMYFHYQPTYYHLHVHFSHVKMIFGTFSGKAVLLDDVIYNLSVNSDHYKNSTVSFVVGEMQHKPLFELYRENNVLNDLLVERGLSEWQVVGGAHISSDSDDTVDVVYGYALTTSLQEARIDRKRKRKAGKQANDNEQPTWCCFLVLPAVSSLPSPTLSIKRLLELQQCADANEPTGVSTSTKQTFLCLTDAANIRWGSNSPHKILEPSNTPRTDSLLSPLSMQLLRSPDTSNPAMKFAHQGVRRSLQLWPRAAIPCIPMRLPMLSSVPRGFLLNAGRTQLVRSPAQRSVTTITPGASTNTDRPLPLKGIRVVECGHLIAGPFAGTILSYFGADVIKVEPPTGDQIRDYRELDSTKTSLWWYSLGRNKRSVAIDMKKEEGRKLIKELIERSDVLIENFRPGRMEKWGLGPDNFEKTNPKLVYTRVSGFGQDGPYSSRPGFASVCEAMGGFRYVNGFPDRPPVRPNLSIGDTIAGIHAALGIVIALLGRERGGLNSKGQVVDVAIYESMFNLMEAVVPEYDYSGSIRECSGSTITGIVPSNTYVTKDKKNVVLAANIDSLFVRLMKAIGQEDMATDSKYRTNGDRVEHQAEIDAALAAWTATQDLDTVVSVMEKAAVPVGLVYSVEDMVKDPQYQQRGMFEEVEIPDGDSTRKLKVPAILPKLKDTPGVTQFAGRKLGQDTRQILEDVLGRSKHEIERLLDEKVIFEA
ncbi:hypothetical protein JG688_00000522 [Phytophthora aleatoria]|uniref:m7GpppX diphosphatase n=1 Tax=Phytophthora aleatoria TaxID=2496075 RepID=A0A8J5MA62_9STRA|nr:hypothetical protein JG688_00000522 [Phytophthora aleatoria]